MPDDSDKLKEKPLENPEEIEAGMDASEQASEELPFPVGGEHLGGTGSKDLLGIKEIIDSGKLPGRNEMVSAIQAIPQTLFEAVQLVVSRMDKSQALQEKEFQLHEREVQVQEKEHELHEREVQVQEKDHELHKKEVQLQEKEHELHERDQRLRKKEFRLKVIGILYTILWPVLVLICSHYDEIWEFLKELLSKIPFFRN